MHNASESQLVSMHQQSCSTKDPGLTPNPYGPCELKTKTTLIVTEQTQIVVKLTSSSQLPVATSMPTDQSQLLIEQMPFQQLPVATRLIATDKKPISVEPRPPPLPPDANNGPEAVMSAIDAWFDYQDYLESMHMLSQTHRSSTDDGHHPLPVDGE